MMALGGGIYTTQNKTLPGAYINFVSASKASASLSDRGVAAMGLELDWGAEGKVFEVTNGDFQKDSVKLFGYEYTHEKMKGLRDLFLNAKTLYAYRLNGGGTKAGNDFAAAKYSGVRGNDLKVIIQKNIDDESKFDIKTLLDAVMMDIQTVGTAAELVDNDFLIWKKDAALAVTASTPLTGGTNGTVDGAAHQTFLDKLESCSFNTLGAAVTEEAIKGLYGAFTKRMRDELGIKFQTVLFRAPADHEGIINLENGVEGDKESPSLVYWLTGAEAGCTVNGSLTNSKYNGEYIPDVEYTQSELEAYIKAGRFLLHRVGNEYRVLTDINCFVSVSPERSSDFASNQTVRVLDQIANDIAALFHDRYLGKIPNDAAGRISLWNDIVKQHQQLQEIRAIESFDPAAVQVGQGDSKKSVVVVDYVTPTNAMEQLYMTVIVS